MTEKQSPNVSEGAAEAERDGGWGSMSWFQNKYHSQGTVSAAGYFGHSANAFQKMRHAELIEFCELHLDRAPEVIIDYGCATGVLTAQFAKAFPNSIIRGYDFVPELIESARQNFSGMEFGINALPIVETEAQDGTLVLLSEVLYYLSEDDRRLVLTDLRKSAKGRLWIVLASGISPTQFTVSSATKLLQESGFELVTETIALPVYKKIIGYCSAFESLCAQAESGVSPRTRLHMLANWLWRIVPFRWVMKVFRTLANRAVESDRILSFARKLEDTERGRQRSPTNLMILAKWKA